MKFAYADPPYLGCARFYAQHHPDAMIWDDPETHRGLIERLTVEYPDGWAMSASVPSLQTLLPMLPDGCRVCSWVKPFAFFKPGVRVAYAWEPVILRGGRKRTYEQPTIRDWLSCNVRMKRGEGFKGAKPDAFAVWILDLLNVQEGDQFDDLFPGSGVIGQHALARTGASVLEAA